MYYKYYRSFCYKIFHGKIKNGTLEVRKTKEPCHAKMYIFTLDKTHNEDGENPGNVITGSSNLTYSGLRGQNEINVRFKNNAEYHDAKQIFETQRDIFVFQCLIGCRVSDLYKMTYKSIIDNAIEYIPRKTKEERAITVRAPLSDTAKQLIDKYKDHERGSLFPYILRSAINYVIK